MFRLLVAFVTVLTLVSAASQTAAQEVELCPAGDASLVATPSAAMIAALEASPSASPPAEPNGSPTATVAVSPTGSPTATVAVSPTGSPTTAETCRVDIGVFVYMPRAIKIPVGTSVIWTNRHNQIHTATADDSSWDTDDLRPTDTSAPIVFDTPGPIPYHCDEHPEFMFGMIEVE